MEYQLARRTSIIAGLGYVGRGFINSWYALSSDIITYWRLAYLG